MTRERRIGFGVSIKACLKLVGQVTGHDPSKRVTALWADSRVAPKAAPPTRCKEFFTNTGHAPKNRARL